MRLDELRRYRDQIQEIAQRSGARQIRVFGSIAHGTAIDTSDVDVLVEMEPGRSLIDLARIELDLEELLGCAVDVVTENGLRERIRDHVLQTAVAL